MANEKVVVVEAVVISPTEFGLDEKQGKEIESQFTPVIADRMNFEKDYLRIVGQPINPETEKEARELRLKLVKVRTSTDTIHRTAKAYYLAGGKFVDAWKNRNNTVIETMETKLKEIETTTERAEAEKIRLIETARLKELSEFTDVFPVKLGEMSEDAYTNYLVGVKYTHRIRVNNEKIAEKQRLAKLKEEEAEKKQAALENERIRNANELLRQANLRLEGELRAKEAEERRLQAVKYAEIAELRRKESEVIVVGPQTEIEIAKYDTLQKIVDQLDLCNYEAEGGYLKNNVAYLSLKRMAVNQANNM